MGLCKTNAQLLYKKKKVNIGSILCCKKKKKFSKGWISAVNISTYQLDFYLFYFPLMKLFFVNSSAFRRIFKLAFN